MKVSRVLSLAILSLLAGSGCSSFSKSFDSKDSVTQEDNYRVTQDALISPLELPPGFQNPNRNMDANNRKLMGQLNDHNETIGKQAIPSYHADGLSVGSNLSERWLHIDKANANDVWERLQHFLTAQGFAIEDARKDVGIIQTAYLPRRDVVPKTEMSFLGRVLNSWREETAKGALDRLTLRVQTDATGGLNVYFRHSMIIQSNDGDVSSWTYRPYHPEYEAEMLYQSMVYLGASKDTAMTQVKASIKTLTSSLDNEFSGLTLQASMEESWQYVLSLADRAGFTVVSTDRANGIMTIKLPAQKGQEEKGFFSRLFSSSDKTVNDAVLKFKANEAQTDVTVDGVNNQSLVAEQKKSVFQRMGILE
jgi:uncharacterized lipoprotein